MLTFKPGVLRSKAPRAKFCGVPATFNDPSGVSADAKNREYSFTLMDEGAKVAAGGILVFVKVGAKVVMFLNSVGCVDVGGKDVLLALLTPPPEGTRDGVMDGASEVALIIGALLLLLAMVGRFVPIPVNDGTIDGDMDGASDTVVGGFDVVLLLLVGADDGVVTLIVVGARVVVVL